MLKGKTRIELTNIHTNKTDVITHSNMVTNAVTDLCKSDGLTVAPINYSGILGSNKTLFELFGGLFLFEDTLDTDASNYYIPGGNKCIGFGAKDMTKASTVNKRQGIYNSLESGLQEDGSMKMVWDFPTSCANGKISAISLTTKAAGTLGLGSPAKEYDSDIAFGGDYLSFGELIGSGTKSIADGAYLSSMNDYGNYAKQLYLYADSLIFHPLYISGDTLYALDENNLFLYNNSNPDRHLSNNGGKLIIKKFRMPRTHIYASQNLNQLKFIEDEEIQLPSTFNLSYFSSNNNIVYGYAQYAAGYIFILGGNKTQAQVTRINVDTKNVDVFNLTLEDEINVGWNYNNFWQNSDNFVIFTENKLIFTRTKNSNTAIYYDLVDGSSEYNNLYFANSEDIATNIGVTEALCGRYVYATNTSDPATIFYLIDTELDSAQRLNVHRLMALPGNYAINHGGFMGGLEYSVKYGGVNSYSTFIPIKEGGQYKYMYIPNSWYTTRFGYLYPITPPHLLLTKNNLDEAVTKTSAQTMKVIYTLTEV